MKERKTLMIEMAVMDRLKKIQKTENKTSEMHVSLSALFNRYMELAKRPNPETYERNIHGEVEHYRMTFMISEKANKILYNNWAYLIRNCANVACPDRAFSYSMTANNMLRDYLKI